jgi:hypothetical protein
MRSSQYDWLRDAVLPPAAPGQDLVPEDGELGRRLETTSYSFKTTWELGRVQARSTCSYTGRRASAGSKAPLQQDPRGAADGAEGCGVLLLRLRLGGARKFYHPDGNWPCCSGTYPQVLADYHNVVYFRDAGGLLVNLFVPSRAAWNQGGTLVSVEQETTFPDSDTTTLTVGRRSRGLRREVPRAGVDAGRRGRGQRKAYPVGAQRELGGPAADWSAGDRVTIRLPMRLRCRRSTQHPGASR